MSTEAATLVAAPERLAEGSLRAYVGRALCLSVPLIIWFAPLPVDARIKHSLAIASFMILAWITEAIDYALAGLIGCYLFWALGVVPFAIAFRGFATDTPWFLFGAILFGAMAAKTGLGRRIAAAVMQRVGTTYSRILLGLIITDFLLTFVIPSGVARVVVMGAVALGLAQALGIGPGSNVGRAMFLIITYTASIFDKMIIAGAASITARGAIERFGGVEVLWSRWFLAYLPCDILTILAAWRLTLWLFPPEKGVFTRQTGNITNDMRNIGGWDAASTRAALLIAVAIGLWVTDFIHHISPSIIGLGVGLASVVPGVGVLSIEDMKRMNYLPVFFVAAAVSMGEVLSETKALGLLTDVMLAWMEPMLLGSIFLSTMVLYWTAFVYHFFLASEISMLGTSIPVLMNFAKSHGLEPLLIGMIWTFGASGKLFAYQSGVLVVGLSYGFFGSRDLFRLGLLLTLVQCVVLLILVFLYWPLIGLR
jgi:solute carrier family 13 (sodium-dependent dicarboxylate transporter), member 2/3/5